MFALTVRSQSRIEAMVQQRYSGAQPQYMKPSDKIVKYAMW